jgi:autotransporter passenger strand-loop-strand repeat protein
VTVDDGGAAVVSSGGLLSASLVNNGGVLRVEAGGAVSGITVAGSAIVDLTFDQADEGTTTNVTVEPHGVFGTFGTAISTTVNGGTFSPSFQTSAVSTTINSGGVDNEGGTGFFTTVNSGGSLLLFPAEGSRAQTINTTINGGSEIVEGLGTVTDTVIDGGVLNLGDAEFPGAISATGGIGFGAAAGTLVIGSAVMMSGAVISGFAAGDTIDLTSLAPGSATIDTPGDVLTVSGGGTTEMLQFAGDYSAAMFQVTGDTGSGSLVTELPCYAAGTHIATAHGEVPVEALAPGDMVLTHAGEPAPVRWVGHRRVDCRRHPKPRDLWPVRVRAGAFGRGLPHRDLLLSPDHAVFAGGVLIPVRYLINGATVIQEIAERVAYWHVELDRHSVILAEGLPCESYLDTGNRAAFANGGAAAQVHPDFALRVWDAKSCAPLVLGGAHLAAAKRHLLAQAARLGHHMTGDPGLRILVDGREVAAEVSEGRQWRVRLPATARTGRLVSRVWVPGQMRPDEDDARSLGVAISRVWRDRREVNLGSDGFSAGWHAPEPGWRWTDGNARLALTDVRELAFEVAMTGTYWQRIISTRWQRPLPAARAGGRARRHVS